jgi:hypothetical protein
MALKLNEVGVFDWNELVAWNAGMVPITVTAHLAAGFSSGDSWSPTLDGILAWAFMKEKLGPDFGTNIDLHPVTGLPLAVNTFGSRFWWYECGLPEWETKDRREKRVHRTSDCAMSVRSLGGRSKIGTGIVNHDNLRRLRLARATDKVTWKAVGFPDEVQRLLSHVSAVGSGWSRGYGRVTRWTVEPGFQGSLRRHIPLEVARYDGIDGRELEMALVPPSHLAENRVMCVIPDPEPALQPRRRDDTQDEPEPWSRIGLTMDDYVASLSPDDFDRLTA